MTDPLSFAIQLAQQAGDLLAAAFRKDERAATWKDDHSLVTQADVASDQLITALIRQNFPDDLIMSEELQPGYPFRSGSPDRAVWVIDPLDGTTNFHLGLHYWGVLIARLVDGSPDTAALYFPLLGELYSAQKGRGAFLNHQPLEIDASQYRKLSFFACCSRTFRHYQVNIPFKPRILGSAAYNVCCVARSIAVLSFDVSPKIWDIAGAWLLLEEAGGSIQTYDGSQPFPVRAGQAYADMNFPVLAGATPELIARWRQEIQLKPK